MKRITKAVELIKPRGKNIITLIASMIRKAKDAEIRFFLFMEKSGEEKLSDSLKTR